MEAHGVGKILGSWGAILVLAGCATAPKVVMRDLPIAGQIPSAGASIGQVSLQEVVVSGRGDRIFLTRVVLRNRTGAALGFGPQHVYLADAGGTLILRISERWLPGYYNARIRGIPVKPDRKAIASFPLSEVRLGDARYTAPPLTADQKDELAIDLATLVEEAFVRPQKEAPGTFLQKGPEVTLGILVSDGTLRPGDGISGYVYFYHPTTREPLYPLRLVIELQQEVHTFLFRER